MSNALFPAPDDARYLKRGTMENVPVNVSHLAGKPGEPSVTTRIGFKWQPQSQHVSIENFQPPSYYEDYIMTTSCSASIQALQKAQMDRLITLHESGKGLKSLVEIGCGDGSFLKYARERVGRILGIEPSKAFAAEAIKAGFDVMIGYVGSNSSLTTEKFDAFVSRQVFEHLPDPADVLKSIRGMLNPGAVGLIEVPNGQRSLRRKQFYDFFPDHVNYYSVNSLVALATDAGFNVVSCNETFGGDYLELWLRYEPEPDRWFAEMISQRECICAALLAKIDDLKSQYRRVAIWGCGAKTLCLLSSCSPRLHSRMDHLIDSDPHKHGRYVPGTSLQILSPEAAGAAAPEVIIVLALSYRQEIAAAIHAKIPSCRLILTLDNSGQVSPL